MILREYWVTHLGKVARVGCEKGSGFVFANEISLDIPYKVGGMMEREICSVTPSCYGGDIVIVKGDEYGNEWLPKRLENPPTNVVPDEMYMRMADRICGAIIEALWAEMVKTMSVVYDKKREDAWNQVDYYTAIVRSPTFATLCPHADAEDILTLLGKRFKDKFHIDFWETRKCRLRDS